MNYEKVLNKLQNGELSLEEAYTQIYKPKKQKVGKRAFFIKMRVYVPDEGKAVNTFLRILFALPLPIIFARIGLAIGNKFAKIDEDFDLKKLSKLLKYSKNSVINVDSDDARVDIKII